MADNKGLPIWVIYERPPDYIAILWRGEKQTSETMVARQIEAIRQKLSRRGFIQLDRSVGDAADIVETWI